MKLSEKIFTLRKEKGLSQEELAEKLNVSRQAVSRWEGGSALPDATNVLQLSKLFEVSADYLLNDDYEQPNSTTEEKTFLKRDIKKVVACWVSGIGLGAQFIIYLVSRFVQVPAPSVYWKDGQKWYRWDGELRTSYKYFIQEYDLELLVYLFWLMAVAGAVYLIVTHEKVKPYLKKFRRVSNGISDGADR